MAVEREHGPSTQYQSQSLGVRDERMIKLERTEAFA